MYDNGTKETMRGWTWNRIGDFIPPVLRKTSTVFYLPGEHDFDRSVGVSKGFRSANMFAIDRDENAIEVVRKNGGRGIVGELVEVLRQQVAHEWRPNVIVADLMCGLYRSTLDLMRIMMCFNSTVVAVNLLRGRDPIGALHSRQLSENGVSHDSLKVLFKASGALDLMKHRGVLAYLRTLSQANSLASANGIYYSQDEWCANIAARQPVVTSYRSQDSGNYFDLLVFKNTDMPSKFKLTGTTPEQSKKIIAEHYQSEYKKQRPRKAVVFGKRLAAARAVRSKDINAN